MPPPTPTPTPLSAGAAASTCSAAIHPIANSPTMATRAMRAPLVGMWSVRAAGGVRLAVVASSKQLHNSRPRLAHCSPTACAGDHSSSSSSYASSSNGSSTGGGDRFTVTTPLYYVNAGAVDRPQHRLYLLLLLPTQTTDWLVTLLAFSTAPHMGSAYPTIAADALARYHRLRGADVAFVTGTDEHGEKIALAAAARGMEPKQHCDDIAASYQALWRDVRAGSGRLTASSRCAQPLALL